MTNEGLSCARNPVEYLVDALLGEFRKRACKRPADELAIAGKLTEGLIGKDDLVIGPFDQRHKAGRLLEHSLKAVVVAAQMSDLIQHGLAI